MKVKLYGKPNCAGCDQAKALLDAKGLGYEYVNIMTNMDAMRGLMAQGLRGVPQIYIDDEHIGGVEQLRAVLA